MKFDVVIGNPPYNNDLYLDFVQAGYQMLKDDGAMVMITPAKWQAKGGRKNEAFREQIVPHMKEIVYYPDCTDIFSIGEGAGIAVYSIDKNIHNKKDIRNVCVRNTLLNGSSTREIRTYLDVVADSIIDKVSNVKHISIKKNTLSGTNASVFGVEICNNMGTASGHGGNSCLFTITDYKTNFISKAKIVSKNTDNSHSIIFVGCKQECESFNSYLDTMFVRFLAYVGKCGTLGLPIETFRFVPDPGAFDHIFTDAELYQKYGLTQDEINIIESVIKERK